MPSPSAGGVGLAVSDGVLALIGVVVGAVVTGGVTALAGWRDERRRLRVAARMVSHWLFGVETLVQGMLEVRMWNLATDEVHAHLIDVDLDDYNAVLAAHLGRGEWVVISEAQSVTRIALGPAERHSQWDASAETMAKTLLVLAKRAKLQLDKHV